MKIFKLIEDMIITLLNEATLNLKKQAIKDSEFRIAKLEYKLENAKIDYKNLLKESIEWCEESKKKL